MGGAGTPAGKNEKEGSGEVWPPRTLSGKKIRESTVVRPERTDADLLSHDGRRKEERRIKS